MLEVAGDDPLKQIQFADAVWKRFIGLKHKIVKDDEQPGSNYHDETEDCIAIFIDDIRSTKATLTRVERRASRSASAQRPRYQLDSDEETEILKRISKDGKPRAASYPRVIV